MEPITQEASVAAAIVQITLRMKSSLYHLLTNSLPTGRREGGFSGTQRWSNNPRTSAIGPTALPRPQGMREVRPAVVTQPNEANGHPSIGDDPPQRDARRSMIIVAGLLSHIVPCAKSVRDFMWALTVALVSLATLLFEGSYCERITTL